MEKIIVSTAAADYIRKRAAEIHIVRLTMQPKQKVLIERFINGEKQLFREISHIMPDDSVHGKYLSAFLADDMPATLLAKKAVQAAIPKPEKKPRPSFKPRKNKND